MKDKISKHYSYEELKAEWDREDIWMKEHPFRAFFIRLYRDIRRFIYNVPDMPRDAYRKVKRGIQRGYRGWADEDVCNLFHYQAKVIYEMLVHLKKTKHGYPATFDSKTDKYDYDEKRWDEILDKIIYAFKLNMDVANGDRESYAPLMPSELQKEFKCLTQREECDRLYGMILYGKYFFALWD